MKKTTPPLPGPSPIKGEGKQFCDLGNTPQRRCPKALLNNENKKAFKEVNLEDLESEIRDYGLRAIKKAIEDLTIG